MAARNPREGIESPHKRAAEKQEQIAEWLLRYHHSTVPLLMRLLGLNSRHNRQYFRKLVERDFLRPVEVPFMKEDLLMLTRSALPQLDDPHFLAGLYNPDPSKINLNLVFHDLAVQRAVINRLPLVDHWPDRFLKKKGERSSKVPDALITNEQGRVALEMELTAKTEKRMFIALADHLRAFRDDRYDSVVYLFRKQHLLDYYKERFDRPAWPIYRFINKRWVQDGDKVFEPDTAMRGRFQFMVEELD